MEVLNKQERMKSFLMFLLIFGITIFVIVFAIFFDYYLPWRENAELKSQNEMMKQEYMFQDEFSEDMEELKTYVDSLNAPGQDFYYNQQKAINTIIKMQQTIPAKDSIARSLMYNNILLTNRKLIDAKKTIKMLGNSKEEIDQLLEQLESYKKELEIVKRELEVCRLINKEK